MCFFVQPNQNLLEYFSIDNTITVIMRQPLIERKGRKKIRSIFFFTHVSGSLKFICQRKSLSVLTHSHIKLV